MSASLIGVGLLMGAASSPHCAAMCAAPCTAALGRCGAARPACALAAWHAGRGLGYAGAGAVAAASVGLLARAADASRVLAPFWTLLQVALLVFGVALIWRGRLPRWVDAAGQRVARRSQAASSVIRFTPRGVPLAAATGVAWTALPCGMLYAALAIAALAPDPLGGAGVMAAYAAGSSIGLFAAPLVLRRLFTPEGGSALRLAGAMLMLSSGWAIWHGLGDTLGAWCAGSVAPG